MSVAATGRRVLYSSGEESVRQVQGRAERLGGMSGSLFLQAETSLDSILDGADGLDPAVIVLDSIQTVYVPALGGTPGNFSQVRECASRMVLHAKATGRAVLLVGHVTKDGKLAGPKTLEHVVDTVVYFEGEAHPPYRVLRSRKNRFGATGELGLFEMTGAGLIGVAEPSAVLLQDRPTDRPGTVVTAAVEGSRTLLLEVQALVAPGFPGSVRRTALGIDSGRLAMLVAVLGKADLALYDKEVYINVVGGVRVTETAVDLAVAAAIVSSLLERPMPSGTFVVGEIGLTGEVRTVSRLEQRLAEAKRHGFTRAVVPKLPRRFEAPEGLEIVEVRTIEEVVQGLFFH
jgi:DNA repair protein RadA/Sms